MMPQKIIHIDYGTKGNSAYYLEQLLRAYSGVVPVEAFVHKEYVGETHGAKVTRIFEAASRLLPAGFIKNVYKLVDIYVAFFLIYIALRRKSRTDRLYVFISLFQSFHVYKWFLGLISKYAVIVITVHDAVEHKHNYPKIIMCNRDDILSYADAIIVHGRDSCQILSYLGKKTYDLPFPLSTPRFSRKIPSYEHVKFLYIGHIRAEKGVDILIDAWRDISLCEPNAYLTIAGTYSGLPAIDFKNLFNVNLLLNYQSDSDFERLILDTDYVVLPYTGGTNSGVLSMSTSYLRPCITSRIPLFTESQFTLDELMYEDGKSGLISVLKRVIGNHGDRYSFYQNMLSEKLDGYLSIFSKELTSKYSDILRIDKRLY